MSATSFTVEVQARRRNCACCPRFIYLPIHPGGQNVTTDDIVDRALWTYRWAKVNGLVMCPACQKDRPHLDDDIEEEREAGMSIRVVASDGWRKR